MKFKITVIAIFIFGNIVAQNFWIYDTLPSISVGAGVLSFKGDFGRTSTASSTSRMRLGYHVSIGQRLNSLLDIALSGSFGTLSSAEYSQVINGNFVSKIKQGDVSLFFRTDELLSDISLTPFAGIGIGFLSFDSYGDLLDKNGKKYFYWSDGSIRDRTETTNTTTPLLIHDYTYETQLKDSVNNYSRKALTIPLTLGFNFKMLDNLSVKMGSTYFLTLTDYIDNVKANGNNDSYIYTNVTLTYRFRFIKRTEKVDDKRYDNVDFEKIEEEMRKKKLL